MTYRSILLYIDEGPDVDAHSGYAAGLARLFDARLVGLSCRHVAPPLPEAADVAQSDAPAADGRAREDAAAARETTFLRHCRQAGLKVFAATRDAAPAAAALCSHARGCDLVVMGAPESAGPRRATQRGLIDAVLLEGARPVLLLPRTGRFEPGQGRALVAWDASLGAAHAASAALPLLQRARSVDLVRVVPVSVGSDTAIPVDIARAVAWLSRHGVDVQVRLAPGDRKVGPSLLFDAKATGARLLVMGAWGRPRIVERLLGGATRDVLENLAVPTLFAH